MLVDGDEYDTNVRKLTLMGFGNTCQVKEALESSNNDIDSAITFLVNVRKIIIDLLYDKTKFQKPYCKTIHRY